MIKEILVLLDELLCAEVAVLVKQVDFQDLFAVGGISIGKDVCDEEGEDVAEGTVAKIGGEGVVVVGVEELDEEGVTRRAEMPPA